MAHHVTVYGTTWCSDCKRAKRFLGDQQVEYKWIDVEQNEDAVPLRHSPFRTDPTPLRQPVGLAYESMKTVNVYAKATENLQCMIASGVLLRDERPCYYVYRLSWQYQGREKIETGLAAVASLSAYAENRIRKHEHTTLAKEDDRVRQIEAVNAQTGPVMLAYPTAPAVDTLLARAASGPAAVGVTAEDGVVPGIPVRPVDMPLTHARVRGDPRDEFLRSRAVRGQFLLETGSAMQLPVAAERAPESIDSPAGPVHRWCSRPYR